MAMIKPGEGSKDARPGGRLPRAIAERSLNQMADVGVGQTPIFVAVDRAGVGQQIRTAA
jgi:hypothetical protein